MSNLRDIKLTHRLVIVAAAFFAAAAVSLGDVSLHGVPSVGAAAVLTGSILSGLVTASHASRVPLAIEQCRIFRAYSELGFMFAFVGLVAAALDMPDIAWPGQCGTVLDAVLLTAFCASLFLEAVRINFVVKTMFRTAADRQSR